MNQSTHLKVNENVSFAIFNKFTVYPDFEQNPNFVTYTCCSVNREMKTDISGPHLCTGLHVDSLC